MRSHLIMWYHVAPSPRIEPGVMTGGSPRGVQITKLLSQMKGVSSMKTKLLDQSAPRGDQFHLSGSAILAVVVMALSSTMFVDVLAAQGVFGRISGAVTDSQGGAIAGAKISIVNEDTKLTRSTMTD